MFQHTEDLYDMIYSFKNYEEEATHIKDYILQKTSDPHVLQAIAYSFARAGDVENADTALDELMQMLDVKIPWQAEMADRARALKSQLGRNASNAREQLEAWEVESNRNLRLENFQ